MTEITDFFSLDLDSYLTNRLSDELQFDKIRLLIESKNISSVYLLPLGIPVLYKREREGFNDHILNLLVSEITIPELRDFLIEKYVEFDSEYSDTSIYFDADAFAEAIGAEPKNTEYWVQTAIVHPKYVKQYQDFDTLKRVKSAIYPETFIHPDFEQFCIGRIPKLELNIFASEDGNTFYNAFSDKPPNSEKYLFDLEGINDLITSIQLLNNDTKHNFKRLQKYSNYFDTASKIRDLIMKHRYTYISHTLSQYILKLQQMEKKMNLSSPLLTNASIPSSLDINDAHRDFDAYPQSMDRNT